MKKVVGNVEASKERESAENTTDSDDDVLIDIRGADDVHVFAEKRRTVHSIAKSEILAGYEANPHAKKQPIPRKKRKCCCTCYTLRKWLGCAFVPLHTAVLEGDIQAARKTLNKLSKSNPTEINKFSKYGSTALSVAAKIQDVEMVELIAETKGCDINKGDKETGLRPLHHSVHVGSLEIANILAVQKDVNVDVSDKFGTTPLMQACELGHENIVRFLLDTGNADPEKCDQVGWNSLFYAAYGGNVKVVQIILDEGVDKLKKDKKRRRAIDWAKRMKHGAVVSLIEHYRSKLYKKPIKF